MLKDGSAIKIPLADLAESKEKVRSALNRATRKAGRTVATASDASFLYVWNVSASAQEARQSSNRWNPPIVTFSSLQPQ